MPDTELNIKACYSTWADSYHRDYFGPGASYPPVHRDIVLRLIHDFGARTLLDAGCGPATFLREMTGKGIDLYGFDLTPQMVAEARRVLAERAVNPDHVWEGSVADPMAFRRPAQGAYDAAISIGVLPHVPEEAERTMFANLRDSVRPGGMVVVEARNQLFALFTLNRYSYGFFINELIGVDKLAQRPEGLDAALAELRKQFRMDLPLIRKGKEQEPGYDQVLSRTHNPVVLAKTFAESGFKNVHTLYYHFHSLPPMLEGHLPEFFRSESLARENAEDWRGMFMASAFLLVGERS